MLAIKNDQELLSGLGQKVRLLRLEKNWTRQEMVVRSDIPYSTLRRIESTGEGSMRDYIKAFRSLGSLDGLADLLKPPPVTHQCSHRRMRASSAARKREDVTACELSITISEYPQLQAVAWNRRGDATCTEAEALALYERNWRFVDREHLIPAEKALIDRLVNAHGNGVLHV